MGERPSSRRRDEDARNRALLEWYESERRPLPWREDPQPWPVLVSEVMLQQTQVSRVEASFGPFMARFPTPGDLAEADTAEVVRMWGGLGYQRRAIGLRDAAALISAHGWPTTVEGLQSLPGVGPYTAAAVACFAFGTPIAAVDTNLRRVLSRWYGTALDGTALRRLAGEILDEARAADWNQAVMDLGAELCRPRRPRCDACPVTVWCADPGVYQPPPRQSTYEGSVRQARAAIMKHLAHNGPLLRDRAAEALTLDPARVDEAMAALERERLVVIDESRVRLQRRPGG